MGDTVWDITLATGVTQDSLVKLNNLINVDALTIGQTLRLQPAVCARPRSTAPAAKPHPASHRQPEALPTPTQAPAYARAARQRPSRTLQQRLAAEALRVGGPNVHMASPRTNLGTGERVLLHADDAFPSTSMMKLPILVELERQITQRARFHGPTAWRAEGERHDRRFGQRRRQRDR